jgi:DNA-binding transcriptional MerR regulator
MPALLSIGKFSQLTHLSVKALRHYDDIGLLKPADVDPSSGYRRYATSQVPVAQIIHRFRDLDMPIEEVRAVLAAPDIDARDRAVIAHLERMQETLAQTQETVASLQALLERAESSVPVEYRSVPAMRAIAIHGDIGWDQSVRWVSTALCELRDVVAAAGQRPAGPDSALFSADFFEAHSGDVVAYLPIREPLEASGRAELFEVPAANLAVTLHCGSYRDMDQAYGALGTFVVERVLGTDGPIREHFLVANAADSADLRTEVCWPIRAGAR